MNRAIVAAMRNVTMGACLAAAFGLAGCNQAGGPTLEPAGGTVTYNTAPVKGATVTFVYENGDVSNGTTGDDGKFTMTTGGRAGAIIGKAKVLVVKNTARPTGMPANPTWQDMAKMNSELGENMKSAEKPKPEIPVKYSDQTLSDLVADVQSGADNSSFVFELKD